MKSSKTELNKTKSVAIFYSEDIVKKKNPKKGWEEVIGMVSRVFDEDDEEEEDSDEEELEIGQVYVDWNNGKSGAIDERDLILLDRSFLHGDIVGDKRDPFKQSGIIVGVDMICDVMIVDEEGENDVTIVQNVNSKHLEHIHMFGNRTMFVFGNWICSIDEILFKIHIKFDDDAECIIENPDVEILEGDYNETIPYYPGQCLDFDSKAKQEILREAKWIDGKFKKNQFQEGIVSKVIVNDLEFTWITDGFGTEPPEDYDITKFKVFSHFVDANWAVFDKAFMSSDLIEMKKEERSNPPKEQLNLKEITNFDDRTCVEVFCTQTTVDVMWQDGTLQKGVKAIDLCSIEHAGDQDFWPEDFVKLKEGPDSVGFIQTVDAKQKTCFVKWDKDSSITEHSIYEIMDHPDYQYQMGDIVIRLPSDNKLDRDVDWIGEVIGIKDGMLDVSWITDTRSMIKYCDVLNAKCFMDDAESEDEGQPDQRDEVLDLAHQLMERLDSGTETDPQRVNDFLSQLGTFINREEESQSKREEVKENSFQYKATVKPEDYILDDEIEVKPSVYDEVVPLVLDSDDVNEVKVEKIELVESVKNELGIEKFRVVSDTKDHHFANEKFVQSSSFVKVIQKEWKLLQQNLPDDLFVIAYENNMNLMRAVMVGPNNTPYAGGIFVFDLLIPSLYPQVPPKVHFWSYGQRLNPNLYESGKVCLSLLGTWEGRDVCENWNPQKSNVLQCLVSLFGLVLNAEPYYNEAGYEKQVGTLEGKHNSTQYSENVVISMIQHLKKCIEMPPQHTEDICKLHYDKNLQRIIDRLLGLEKKDLEELGITQEPSQGFKIIISKSIHKIKK